MPIRIEDAPREVRFDSARRARLKAEVLRMVRASLGVAPGREVSIDVEFGNPDDTAGWLMHSIFEEIRQEDPRFTLRYGSRGCETGIGSVSLARTQDVAVAAMHRDMQMLQTAGFFIGGGE